MRQYPTELNPIRPRLLSDAFAEAAEDQVVAAGSNNPFKSIPSVPLGIFYGLAAAAYTLASKPENETSNNQ